MANNITPVIGIDLTFNGTLGYNDINESVPSPPVGTRVTADDGHVYLLAKNTSGSSISATTAVVLTEPAMTIAAGAGAWTTQAAAVPNGNYCWVKRTAI
jgi:DNA-binding beta-propeller fold protein YncE